MHPWIENILNISPISSIRRNHALEHATMQILAVKYPGTMMAGHSDFWGFSIIGNVSSDAVESASQEALQRLQKGEYALAIHPNCGTNFAVSGTLAGLAGAAAMFKVGPRLRDKLDRLSLAAVLGTIALIFAQPLGSRIQANITTAGDPKNLQIVDYKTSIHNHTKIHRIHTHG